MSVSTFFSTGTGMDVIQGHIFPHLSSLIDCANLSRCNKFLYSRLGQRDQALYVMRQVWSIQHLTRLDKIITVCKTNIYKAFVCVWHLEHPDNQMCSSLHFMQHAVFQGDAQIVRFLTQHLNYETKHKEKLDHFFAMTVTNLMKNGHTDLAFHVFANTNGHWWTKYEAFTEHSKFICWREAIKSGEYALEQRMLPLFNSKTDAAQIESLRLLISVNSFKRRIFDYYLNQIELTNLQKSQLIEHAHFTLMAEGLQQRGLNNKDTRQREKMADHLLLKMRAGPAEGR